MLPSPKKCVFFISLMYLVMNIFSLLFRLTTLTTTTTTLTMKTLATMTTNIIDISDKNKFHAFSPPQQSNGTMILSTTLLLSENTPSQLQQEVAETSSIDDIIVVSPSSECVRQRNTIEFKEFCHKQTYSKHQCQKIKVSLPKLTRTRTIATTETTTTTSRLKGLYGEDIEKSNDRVPISNNSSTDSISRSFSRCKTVWITGMSLGFENKHDIANGGDGYALQYAAALRSYQKYAKDIFQPVLILLTPTPTPSSVLAPMNANKNLTSIIASPTNNSNNNNINDHNNIHKTQNSNSLVRRFTQWLEKQGVIVINIHALSFQDLVFRAYPEYAKNGAIAYYLRFDIPKILLERDLFLLDRPEICGSTAIPTSTGTNNNNNSSNNVVFYTDSDILFVQSIEHDEIQSLKGKLTKNKFLMYGQDFSIDRPKPSNTGVMFMHLEGFKDEWPNILRWGEQQLAEGQKRQMLNSGSGVSVDIFPKHDQLWLNAYYVKPKKWKAQNLLLPPAWNWKVYWEIEIQHDNHSDNNNNDNDNDNYRIRHHQIPVKLVHFHGPKPQDGIEEIARCDTKAVNDVLNTATTNLSDNIDKESPPPPTRSFHPDYEMFVSHGMCCDLGKTAAWVLQLYDRWKPQAIPW